jgi:uncharacterized membrane protein (UPF0127 family)
MQLIIARTNEVLANSVEVAASRRARRAGLLGRDALDASGALVIDPCWMIHTAFMRFPIDVLFIGRDGRVVRIAPDVQPWRAAASMRARRVIELPAGTASRRRVAVGDTLRLC